jgi:hypothetical protein
MDWNETSYEEQRCQFVEFLGNIHDENPEMVAELLTNYLEEQVRLYGGGINRDYALLDFERLLSEGHDALAKHAATWVEECVTDLRWPIAFVHESTAKLPYGWGENTAFTVVVAERSGKVLGAKVFHWAEFAGIEDDKKCYRSLRRTINDVAYEMGARSLFSFYCEGTCRASVAMWHSPQGAIRGNERSYEPHAGSVEPRPMAVDGRVADEERGTK